MKPLKQYWLLVRKTEAGGGLKSRASFSRAEPAAPGFHHMLLPRKPEGSLPAVQGALSQRGAAQARAAGKASE